MFIRTAYNYDTMEVSDLTGLLCLDKSLAKQEFLEESDINLLIKKFGIGHIAPDNLDFNVNSDFSDVPDFQTAMNLIKEATDSFMQLDADTRYRFRNDPGRYVDFCSDPRNIDEMAKMGLAVIRPQDVPKDESPAAQSPT